MFDTPTNDVKLFIEILDTVQSSINRQINLQKVIEGSRYKMTGKLRTKWEEYKGVSYICISLINIINWEVFILFANVNLVLQVL